MIQANLLPKDPNHVLGGDPTGYLCACTEPQLEALMREGVITVLRVTLAELLSGVYTQRTIQLPDGTIGHLVPSPRTAPFNYRWVTVSSGAC